VPSGAAVAPPPPPPRPPVPAADTGSRRYLVLGSFSTRENAARFAGQLGQPGLAVVPVKLAGRTVYRVVAGPLAVTGVADLRAKLAAKGAGDTWEVASLPPG
jgi:cell division protein FtsN